MIYFVRKPELNSPRDLSYT